MPSHIARSNIVLIPKSPAAARVTEFRPISVCNISYKIISKLLASRIRPIIGSCVSASQSAFVPGRDISENVILLREILHSFKQKNYKKAQFCLKADLSKAFDRMQWDYLEEVLPLYGFPTNLISWIMACVRSAEYTIMLNGRGDGFFKPTCGLRQGCSLSPYLFIIGMDILSRQLQLQSDMGKLRGIRLSNSAASLTSCLYADDLLLFGEASVREATTFKQIWEDFSEFSGQQIGSSKSSIWFSDTTDNTTRGDIEEVFQVPNQLGAKKYLGAPIIANSAGYEFLIDRVSGKLQAWKGRMLSHAGRVVLIKTVLHSLPIYYMATSKIPQNVMRKIKGIIVRFFWGKSHKNRYMAYVSWENMCKPISSGGLGFKNLEAVNDAMLLKQLWKLAYNQNSQWAKFVKEKYLPRSALWTSKRTYNCTVFWRCIMGLREVLLPTLKWDVGDGRTCRVIGEPWFEGSMNVHSSSGSRLTLTVNQLVDTETGMWDSARVIEVFGYGAGLQIISNLRPPTLEENPDSLVCNLSSNGSYTVKGGYKHLMQSQQQVDREQVDFWDLVWNRGNLQPRVRLFIWKLSKGALPLSAIISSRINSADPTCATCVTGNEDVAHLLFICPFSRCCWFASCLALRSDKLWELLQEGPWFLTQQLSHEQWTDFANITWAIWKCRNDRAYNGTNPTIELFHRYFYQISAESKIASTGKYLYKSVLHNEVLPESEYICWSDGSWTADWKGGIGGVLFKNGVLIAYWSKSARACCPLLTEALALKEGILQALKYGLTGCLFLTDSKELAGLVTQLYPPLQADWKVFKEVQEIWKLLQDNKEFRCHSVPRSHIEMVDYLAKKGRSEDWNLTGSTYPLYQDYRGA